MIHVRSRHKIVDNENRYAQIIATGFAVVYVIQQVYEIIDGTSAVFAFRPKKRQEDSVGGLTINR